MEDDWFWFLFHTVTHTLFSFNIVPHLMRSHSSKATVNFGNVVIVILMPNGFVLPLYTNP